MKDHLKDSRLRAVPVFPIELIDQRKRNRESRCAETDKFYLDFASPFLTLVSARLLSHDFFSADRRDKFKATV